MIWNESVLGSFKELVGTLIGQLFPEILMLNDGSQSLSLEICLQLLSLPS